MNEMEYSGELTTPEEQTGEEVRMFFRQAVSIADEELLARCCAVSRLRTLRKGEVLIRQGELPTALHFLLDGALRRGFAVPPSGELTDGFAWRMGDVALPGAAAGLPSPMTVEAASFCTLVEMPIGQARELLRVSPEAADFSLRLLTRDNEQQRAIKAMLYRCSSMERYVWFLRSYPGLIDKVSGRCVASFLGMTPVTLSRMRSELRRRQAEDQAAAE